MRLKTIKLAGFKSFVEPTTIDLPSDISVVVGPIGCGKSNIVDAVRLAIGESQAGHLRGDSLEDMIFHGADSRSRTAQASVELIFDNQDQRLGGAYAKYAEVSLRREVIRDAPSRYLLNGKPCRRRDVRDLFLGSGFGADGYAIIEQGLISRLVEGKPDEIRAHIEEVAGISKYRERRRETENRIQATETNLERVRDHHAELNRQVSRLQRQAREAERFTELRQRERVAQANLIAFQVRTIDSEISEQSEIVTQSNLEVQRVQTELQSIRTRIEKLRISESSINDQFNSVQGDVFEARSKYSRVGEDIQSRQTRLKELSNEAQIEQDRLIHAKTELQNDRAVLEQLEKDRLQIARDRESANKDLVTANARVNQTQTVQQEWQKEWEENTTKFNSVESEIQLTQAQLTLIENSIKELSKRKESIQKSLQESVEVVDSKSIEAESAQLESKHTQSRLELENIESELDDLKGDLSDAEEDRRRIERELAAIREQRSANLALLESMLGNSQTENITKWLEEHALHSTSRLGEEIHVVDGWERALEAVLGHEVRAIRVDNLASMTMSKDTVAPEAVTVFEPNRDLDSREDQLLNFVIEGRESVAALIPHVLVCETLMEALDKRLSLSPHESIVTRAGIRLGKHWIKFPGDSDNTIGVITRRELESELDQAVEKFEQQLTQLSKRIQEDNDKNFELEETRKSIQSRLDNEATNLSTLQLKLHGIEIENREAKDRRKRQENELREITDLLQRHSANRETNLEKIRTLNREAVVVSEERNRLRTSQQENLQEVSASLDHSRKSGEIFRELDVKFNTMVTSQDSLTKSCERHAADIADLTNRVQNLESSQNEIEEELKHFESNRESLLQDYTKVADKLQSIEGKRNRFNSEIRDHSSQDVLTARRLEEVQVELGGLREQRIKLQSDRDHLIHELSATQVSIEEALANLVEPVDELRLTRALNRIQGRIERLGAVNLAAIQDLEALSEQRDLVGQQILDLEESEQTLKNAMSKIDRQTVALFNQTFERLNEKLNSLFAKVFGGGSARLELTDEDLLHAGVTIIAQPPGKQNRNISALSGGEKALTAISLIFAMFELNPSPVCLLDEVDAPLDDTNVYRFTELIKEMSVDVQFLIISHNRITMQAAESLIGVTMQEAGVSRLVSVDLESAVAAAS